jgi:cytochrome P450
MLEAMNTDKKSSYMTHEESVMASFMLIVAGTDTTSNSMAFATYLLAKHPEVKELLFQELVQAMPDKSSTLRFVAAVLSIKLETALSKCSSTDTKMLARITCPICGLLSWK